jgi:predicted RNase H-like HicB family nuclease
VLADFHQNSYINRCSSNVNGETRMREFDVVLLEDETGGYVAIVPALPGCHTQGDTLAEVMENVKEAIDLYVETLTDQEKKDFLRQKVVGIQKVKALA